VPLDGSQASFNAFDWALRLALPQRASITALCVIDVRVSHEAQLYLPVLDHIGVSDRIMAPAETAAAFEAWAAGIITRVQQRAAAVQFEIRAEIASGVPYQEIISRSTTHDLLVMGGWGLSGDYPGPFLTGSTFRYIVTRTTLPAFHIFGEPQRIKTILVVDDDTPAARDALHLAASWAKEWDLTLVVLVIQPDGDRAQAQLRQARQRVAPVIPRLIARDGDPGQAIRAIAAQHACDLVCLGVPARHLWPGHSLGRVIDDLLQAETWPLLLSH
jgi:nucleotide-binding universal stress UspA family protein